MAYGGVSDNAMTRIVKFLSDKPEILEKPPSQQKLGQAARDILRDIGVEEHTFTLKKWLGVHMDIYICTETIAIPMQRSP